MILPMFLCWRNASPYFFFHSASVFVKQLQIIYIDVLKGRDSSFHFCLPTYRRRKYFFPQYFILLQISLVSILLRILQTYLFLVSFCSISIYKSCQGSKKIRLQHFFTPEKSTVMSLTYMSQYLFAGLVNGNIAIYTKAEGNVVIWYDNILRNLHVSIFWQK